MQPRSEILDNGLRVILVPAEAESVAIGLFVASGSRHEDAARAGISHLIEHMLFKGTPTRKAIDITRAIEGRGGSFDAFTDEDSTAYYVHLPHEYFDDGLDILADMYLNALIPDDEFEREKHVVFEEIRMYADDPDSVALENLQRSLFPGNRLGAPIAGSESSLRPLKPADLRAYVASHYLPSRTVLVVSGRFSPDAALRLIRRRFAVRRSKPARRVRFGSPVDFSVPTVSETVVSRDVQQVKLAVGYRMFGVSDPRSYAASVLSAVLGRGMSSRLFQEVREKRGLSYDIAARSQFFSDAGMLVIAAGLSAENRERTLATIDREIERISTKRIGAAELKRTKDFLTGNFRLSYERVKARMFFYGGTALAFNRMVLPEEQLQRLNAVTADDVLETAKSVFRPENRSVSLVVPR